MNIGMQDYEQRMALSREHFAISPGLAAILSPAIDPDFLELFLVYYCAMGIHMTAPVESWICRAGERCDALGLEKLGRALKSHAKGESGHDLLMIADLRALTARWNGLRTHRLDAESLLKKPLSIGVRRYRDLHENTIKGNAPFAQISIEYEIEMLSLRYGPQLISNCIDRLGSDIVDCLSFLKDHVELDVSHTEFNARELEKLITNHPENVSVLVQAGSAALDAYAQFLIDCVERARRHLKAPV